MVVCDSACTLQQGSVHLERSLLLRSHRPPTSQEGATPHTHSAPPGQHDQSLTKHGGRPPDGTAPKCAAPAQKCHQLRRRVTRARSASCAGSRQFTLACLVCLGKSEGGGGAAATADVAAAACCRRRRRRCWLGRWLGPGAPFPICICTIAGLLSLVTFLLQTGQECRPHCDPPRHAHPSAGDTRGCPYGARLLLMEHGRRTD
ncbi:hypothetical protein B0T11DRAFT_283370 [Plectosphaerella cucumerina]|uniref:Uncharacterized protein n=1 Tax=Plectosphaerella cucumerina TaxID=40658 RepID=A0A8K0TD43_9PEZI|nr:hypothetical protein B0T11DRAFT_283370 [Plectosphaerella cucumerina]